VDDMYIVLETMESRASNSDEDFVTAMKDIFVPVTMTSFVNLSMFFILYLVTDIGGIYDTALAALIAVIFLWVSIVFCYPAYCYLDIKRQAANRYDVLMCSKTSSEEDYDASKSHTYFLFKGYKRLFLGQNALSYLMQLFVVLVTIAFFAVGWYGISQREVGVGLKVSIHLLNTTYFDLKKSYQRYMVNIISCSCLNIIHSLLALLGILSEDSSSKPMGRV